MQREFLGLAFRHAPVLWQKVNDANPRGDYITRVDFAGELDEFVHNWANVSDENNKLLAHAYYSVVETSTHYFILYVFYHGQDWHDGKFLHDKVRRKFDEHLNDLEGALAVVAKSANRAEGRVDAFITVSHFHFYSYANWRKSDDEFLYEDSWKDRIRGYKEDPDGNIWPTEDNGLNRFTLYAQARGHGIKGDRKGWGLEGRVIRYFPSKDETEEPDETKYQAGNGGLYQDVKYKLIDLFEPGGLWENKDNSRIFQTNRKGQDALVELDDEGRRVAGKANPPWGWDDMDDRHKCGEPAINPAKIIHDYFTGLREFSLEYMHNPYLNILKK